MIPDQNKAHLISQITMIGDRKWSLRIPNDANAVEYIIQMCWPLNDVDDICIQSVRFGGNIIIEIYYSDWTRDDLDRIANNLNTIFFDGK